MTKQAAARPKRPLNLSSHTELSTLAACERRWHYKYVEKMVFASSVAMRRGTLLHTLTAAFWRGDDWRLLLAMDVCEDDADPNLIDVDMLEDEMIADVVWLMKRYERNYADQQPRIRVIAQEIDLRGAIPGTRQKHQAIIDEVWEIDGDETWMVERKSYGRNDTLELADMNPQLTNNLWLLRREMPVAGILLDGIYTHRWVSKKPTQADLIEDGRMGVIQGFPASGTKTEQRDWARAAVERHPGVERPDADSFTQLWLDRTDEHIEQAQIEIRGALRRRDALRRGATPLRNIGPFCKNCDAKPDCFAALAFPQEIDLDLS